LHVMHVMTNFDTQMGPRTVETFSDMLQFQETRPRSVCIFHGTPLRFLSVRELCEGTIA
jgi:hypothetical protein